MSMSSLSAQLASINAAATGGKNPGSSLGTSKKHEDAIGRGISHSATHGHVLASTSPLFKPSVLYADAKAASDVPLTTLRENCVSSLRQLAKMTDNDTFVRPQILNSLVGTHSLTYERGLSTRAENDKLDDMIVELLSLLSTSMGESSSLSFSSSLHVIEYLLRRYDIHARTNTAERLILATLPHHEQPVFLRVLQLVDLASMPTWVFLRPYAAKGSPPPTRTAIAKIAARDNVLLVHCCEMAKTAARIHSYEIGKVPSQRPSRRGVSRIISFAAAVIMEGLPMQALNPNNNGSISEPTLRCILPFVLSACGDGSSKKKETDTMSLGVLCPDWRGFGHVLAVAITERCVLSEDARQVLATTLVKGSLEADQALSTMEVDETTHIELAADSILVIMSVLSQNPVSNSDTNSNNENQYLSIIRPNSSKANRATHVGYNLPNATFRCLSKHPFLVKAIAHLYADREISVAPIMASLVSASLSKLVKEKSSKKKHNVSSSCLDLILEIIREQKLVLAWKDKKANLASSFAGTLIKTFAKLEHDANNMPEDIQSAFTSVLDELKEVDPSGCDAGIAYAVTVVCGQKKKISSASRSSRKKRISLLLGISPATSDAGSSSESPDKAVKNEMSAAHLLPPRVALEHPDVAIRLGAIERALKEEMGADSREGESLEYALLRRMNIEDDSNVVAAAGFAIEKILRERQLDNPTAFGDAALSALYRWCIFKDEVPTDSALQLDEKASDKKKKKKKQKESNSSLTKSPSMMLPDDKIRALESALQVAAYATKGLIDEDHNATSPLLRSLIQAIVAHLDFKSIDDTADNATVVRIVDAASNALVAAVGATTNGKSSYENAKMILISNELCSQILKECCSFTSDQVSETKSTALAVERRYYFVILAVFVEFLSTKKESTEIHVDILSVSIQTVSSFPKGKRGKICEKESRLLVRCLELTGKGLAKDNNWKIPDLIISLVSVSSTDVYDQVCLKAVSSLLSDAMTSLTGSRVSPIAVLMECATRVNVTVDAIERLLNLASGYVPSENSDSSPGSIYGVVPALMLFASMDQRVRKAALDFMAKIGQNVSSVQGDSLILKKLHDLASSDKESPGVHSSILMDGATALPKFLSAALQGPGKDASDLHECLVRQCLLTACAYADKSNDEDISNCWLPFGHAIGGCRAASVVLNAMELAGESTFPLSLRWEIAGKEIFYKMTNFNGQLLNEEMLTSCQALLDTVVRMLKGVLVFDSSTWNKDVSNVVISTGPSRRGTRKRSYSLGNIDGVSFVDPYPANMYASIVKVISTSSESEGESNPLSLELCESVVRNVLESQSWRDGVFNKLPSESRREIASCLLKLRSERSLESAGLALLGLPLNAADVHKLLEMQQKESDNIIAITFLADWIRTNSSQLAHDAGLSDLSSSLYDLLAILSEAPNNDSMETDDTDATEFARLCILQTLLNLAQLLDAGNKAKKKSRKEQKQIMNIVNLLVGLIGGRDELSDAKLILRPLLSGRAKSIALSLLTNLCAQQPNVVVGSLIPALLTSIVSPQDKEGAARVSSTASGALLAVVPVYCQHAKSAELSVFDLLTAIIGECYKVEDEKLKLQLYGYLVDAFASVTGAEDDWTPLGSLIAAFVANEVCRTGGGEKSSGDTVEDEVASFALSILAHASATLQVACLLQLLQCVHQFTTRLYEIGNSGGQSSTNFTEIEELVLQGPIERGKKKRSALSEDEYTEDQRTNVKRFTECLLSVVMDAFSITPLRKLIQKSEGSSSAVCLQLWQELLQVQAISSNAQNATIDVDRAFWGSLKSTIDETLEYLQNLLPAHLFLASATSLIREQDADVELRGKAVRLLAERASDVNPNSGEALLFLDMVPVLLELLDGDISVITTQSAMVAIEQIARSLCLPSSADKDTGVFFAALEKGTNILKQRGPESTDDDMSAQIVCSVALCASTLVRVLKAKCLPLLKNLVGPLLESLASANTLLSGSNNANQEMSDSSKMLQLSILRTIIAIADTLPQFLVPYLGQLLSPLGLPSASLRLSEGDENVKVAANRLEEILSKRTPARQLIPALCKASVVCRGKCAESSTLLSILKMSIKSSSRAELATLRSWVLKTVVSAYEYEGKEEEREMLLAAANQMMLSLVLKLSEAQLRPLYSKLREWKSAAGISNNNSRRLAFWSLSSVLSKELRGIFLPCLSTVVADVVEELELSVSTLRGLKESERTADGKKKRRLTSASDASAGEDGVESLRPLQPLLLCLEAALKADAHDGGNWVRVDDGDRFNSILEPLGKLLQSKIPANFPVAVSSPLSKSVKSTPFQRIIQGFTSEEDGNVVSCLTALASAAGNEQLWKPLNHLVLRACEHETRSEVRKAGVTCLLSLIKTLGEEYMVLLPECLPILSELLEDTDEEITSLAQECVSLGEDLLGESLQDSLR